MPEKDLNMTNGAPAKNGAPLIMGQGTNGCAFTDEPIEVPIETPKHIPSAIPVLVFLFVFF
ncbi:MAG: hypothetical protein U0L15_07060, partial [Oscillospiraceae bacterium]|nr:hypothetical protein [Oscillospiraceae bacterium]